MLISLMRRDPAVGRLRASLQSSEKKDQLNHVRLLAGITALPSLSRLLTTSMVLIATTNLRGRRPAAHAFRVLHCRVFSRYDK